MEQNKEHNKVEGQHNQGLAAEGVHHKKNKALSKSFYRKVYIVLGIALVFFALYNMFQISSFGTTFDKKLAEAKEAVRPARIELMVITTNACGDCYDIDAVVDVIKSTGVNITKQEEIDFSAEESQSFIDKYDIKKLPTVILTGELDKSRKLTSKFNSIGEQKQDAYIFTALEPPFVESSTGETRGKVSLIHLRKKDCTDCFDLTPFIEQLSESGLKFEEIRETDVGSEIGRDLIKKYDIEKAPTIIMDKEAEVYSNILASWSQFGSIEEDGTFIMRTTSPPYYSIKDELIKGLVSMTIIKDKFCTDCYDPDVFHKPIILRMGVVLQEEEKFDIADDKGKELIDKYKIEKIPTIILKGDVEEYPALVKAWTDVGTVEDDGAYVFRKVEVARQTYKDLTTNKIIDPQITS